MPSPTRLSVCACLIELLFFPLSLAAAQLLSYALVLSDNHIYTSGATGAKCVAGVGCAANATLCAHANGCYHQQWARDFPAATEIVAWFASIR